MNRSLSLLLAAVALILSAAVTFVSYRVLRHRLQPNESARIVVAAQNINLGTRLSAADLTLAPWAGPSIEGSFANVSDVVNRGVIVPMISNEPVLESKLAPADAGAGLSAAIKGGMRAVAVKVNEVIGVAGFVVAGTRVDVILSGSPDHGRDTEMAKTIIENVEVLSAGKNVARDGEGKPQDVQVVTLLVTPEDSQKLALASVDGSIHLALRNPLDGALINPAAVSRGHLYGKADPAPVLPEAPSSRAPASQRAIAHVVPPAPAVPAPAVPAPAVPAPALKSTIDVQLIQGNKSEKFSFEAKAQ